MCDYLFHLDPSNHESLQAQIRVQIVNAILEGHIKPGSALPSCRELAKQLSVSRNTVVLTYEKLVEDGFLYSKERSGYFVAKDFQPPILRDTTQPPKEKEGLDWQCRLIIHPNQQRNITKPHNWRDYPYPFIYGQLDHELFPLNEWRQCCRDANSKQAIQEWVTDSVDGDDEILLEQLHTRVLPTRGVWANLDEILITMGTQNSLFLVSQLLISKGVTVGIEEPGYVDARNIFENSGAKLVPIPVDEEGLVIDARIAKCDIVYVTPSHQSPTTVTMSLDRRHSLLKKAREHNFVIIEDDYESQAISLKKPIPAMKSLDRHDRVIYVSSMSKSFAPGLRLGYLVAPREFIEEARTLRRLMLRHPPSNNQHTVALFLARGYFDTLAHRLTRVYSDRRKLMQDAFEIYLSDTCAATFGGTSFWVRGPSQLDSTKIATAAAKAGILIEPGDIHFATRNSPKNYFRLAFSSIQEDKIQPGLRALAKVIQDNIYTREALVS